LKTRWPDSPLVVILGPTAVGKTEVAIQLAEGLDGEIISVDSRLFYRGMDIGTAKPSPAEMNRVVHHLVNVADPDQPWSLSKFQEEAKRCVAEVHMRGHLPLLVGGTGQYIRAVIEGWLPPEQPPDTRLRELLESWGNEIGRLELHRLLAIIDPAAAFVIEPTNLRRTVRALEVIFSTGKRFSEQRRRGGSPYSVLQIGLTRPRPELYARIDARIEAMVAKGLLEETRALVEKGYSSKLPSLSAIGYREMIEVLTGQITLDEAVVLMKRKTREYVRRQANWFKLEDPNIHWFDAETTQVDVIKDFICSGAGWMRQIAIEVNDGTTLD
jgi:tRNA dimethylallyltransferase